MFVRLKKYSLWFILICNVLSTVTKSDITVSWFLSNTHQRINYQDTMRLSDANHVINWPSTMTFNRKWNLITIHTFYSLYVTDSLAFGIPLNVTILVFKSICIRIFIFLKWNNFFVELIFTQLKITQHKNKSIRELERYI